MRKLSIIAVLLLIAFVCSSGSQAFAAPTNDDANSPSIAGEDNGDKPKPKAEKKSDSYRSYRDRLDARNKPRAAKKPKEKDKYKPWKEVLKDAEKHEGLFNVYTKREDVYFELKADQLDQPFASFMSLSKGIGARFVLGGLPLSETILFDFHRNEDHVQVRMLNTRFRANGDEALEKAVDLSYGNSVLFNLKIESENKKEEAILVKMNDVFLSDISDVGFFLQLVLRKPVRMDAKKGIYRKIKVFPENVEVEALLTYMPGDRRGLNLPQVPDSRFIEIGVHYSIHKLPETQMKPRLADDRVGYFMTPHKDFSKDKNESFFVYYINRWRLEKEDPGASLSEPKEPITFYVDTTIPEEYRRYVRDGIEMWQKAYEAAGFKNGIVAKDPGDDPDYDPEDARYNTIRWIVSDEPSFGAIGPSRVDPRTGEILDADILMEQNMIAGFRKAYRRYAGPEAFINADPMIRQLKDPATHPEVAAELELEKKLRHLGVCNIADGFANGFGFAQLAMLLDGMGSGMDVPEKFVGEAIMFVTAHEVGHTLGLRHNFKSSISTPYEELNSRSTIDKIGMTGSVMDYAAPNVSRDRSRQGYYYTPVVGTYDDWAIEYGYRELPGDKNPEQEAKELLSLANKASEKRHAYGTDEDTYPAGALDPNTMIWDLSDDPLAWARERLGVCQDILRDGDLVGRVVGDDDNYVALRSAIETILIQEYIATSRGLRYIGAQYTARPHKGDNSGEYPLLPVEAAKQREAMDFIAQNAFSKNAFAVSPEVLNMLADDKLWSWQNNIFAYGRRFDFPMIGWVGGLQNAMLVQLMNPQRMQRMIEAEFKTDDPYRLSEMFRTLTGTIWYDNMVATGKTAVMQRNLQRIYLNKLIQMTVSPQMGTPFESIALSRYHLTNLKGRIDKAYAQKGLSDEANAHLLESSAWIDRALDADLNSSF